MASISPFRIELTEQQRRELEQRAHAYTSPYCQVIRAKIILMAAEGLANNEIAARLIPKDGVIGAVSRSAGPRRLPLDPRFGYAKHLCVIALVASTPN